MFVITITFAVVLLAGVLPNCHPADAQEQFHESASELGRVSALSDPTQLSTLENPEAANESTMVNTPQQILQSALVALREGNTSDFLEKFDDHFTFSDRAYSLEFTNKLRLRKFLEKSRELSRGTTLEIISVFGDGDCAIARWKLSATQNVPYDSISYRFPPSFFASTIVCVENERIVEWSDYWD